MSHITDVQLRIDDLDALEEACQQLGLELQRNKTNYAWWGAFQDDSNAYGEHRPSEMGTCDHAIKIQGDAPRNGSSGPWEVGVVRAKDGDGYKLFFDTYGSAGRRLTEKVGHQANALRREYAAAKATKEAKAKLARHGWTVRREDLPNHGIKLKLRRR